MSRVVRQIVVTAGVLVFVGAGLWFAAPYLFAIAINLTCRQSVVSASCQARMRAVGHLFAARGNLDQALLWYAGGAETGDRIAMFDAGWVERELAAAEIRRRFQQAQAGDGMLYTPVHFGPHAENSAEWYRRSADLDFAPAINNLGEMYRDELGVDEDPGKSFDYHMRAAKAGNPVARINLARDYREGIGTRIDLSEAKRWWRPDLSRTDPADLAEPTLARTFIRGKSIAPEERDLIRKLASEAAAAGSP